MTLPVSEQRRLFASAQRVLDYLIAHGEATNVELCRPSLGGMRAIGRVHDLGQAGYDIESAPVHKGVWKYVLHGKTPAVTGTLF